MRTKAIEPISGTRRACGWLSAVALLAAVVVLVGALAVGAGATSAGSQPVLTSAQDVAARPYLVKPPSKGAYTGVFRPPAPFNPSTISSYRVKAGKPASMVMWFTPWAYGGQPVNFDAQAVRNTWAKGAVPIIVWESWAPGSNPHGLSNPAYFPEWKLSTIAAGDYDAYITRYAQDCKAAGGPIMISLFHEMNGLWYPWSTGTGNANGNTAADYIAAYRHVHDIFAREGANNVTWIWSVNFESRPNNYANRWAAAYPGDAYVDWVAVSGFNWGKGVGGGPWRSFERTYRLPMRYLRTLHKPVMISEFASVEQGGSKSAWIKDAFKKIRTYHPEVKAVIWYDAKERSHGHVQDWRINSSSKSLKAYRAAVKSRYFVGGLPGALAAWRAAGH